jgi:hypothetical protein
MSALANWQIALGRTMQTHNDAHGDALDDLTLRPDERGRLARLRRSPGFRFTAKIQRSWCEARSANAARLTLASLSPERRRKLVAEWVDRGGGRDSFLAGEAEGFLDFLAGRLPDPSHALSLCRFEQALLLASQVAAQFTPPDLVHLDDPDCLVTAGRNAALVTFHAEIEPVFAALESGEALPTIADVAHSILFAPGIPLLLRAADLAEAKLWQSLAEPVKVGALLRQGHARGHINAFATEGAAQIA